MTWDIWLIFTRRLEIIKISTLMGSLYPRYNMCDIKIYRGVVSWKWKMMQSLTSTWPVASRFTWGISVILTRLLESLRNVHFYGLLLKKVYNVWAKKVLRVYVSWLWRMMQNLKRNCRFKINMRNLTNFDTSTWESKKFAF